MFLLFFYNFVDKKNKQVLSFLQFGIIDVIDILLVALLFYQFFMLIKNTAALNIFYVVVGVYFIWVLVKALNFQLLSTILGHIMGVGVIAILIVFQQEIRRFLLLLGSKSSENLNLQKIPYFFKRKKSTDIPFDIIISACEHMKDRNTGALIVISEKQMLDSFYEAGQIINSSINSVLIETIFFKNSPLHDGAMFIVKDKIIAAGCVLPLTERTDLPNYMGLRHRAAIGITEQTDTIAIVVSEERGQISYAAYGKIFIGIEINMLRQKLMTKFNK